jgi:hypothetical protein
LRFFNGPEHLALDAHCSPKKTQFITFRGIFAGLNFLSLDFPYRRDIIHKTDKSKHHMGSVELDQIDLLEKKVDAIISLVISLKEDKLALERKIKAQEEKTDSIVNDIKNFHKKRELAQNRLSRLLEKMDKFKL